MKLNNKTYDALNNSVKLVLPAIGTLYFTFASIWNLPYGEQVVGSFAAVSTFLGILLAVAKRNWNTIMDGSLLLDQTDPKKDKYTLEIATPLEDISKSKSLALKVVKTK